MLQQTFVAPLIMRHLEGRDPLRRLYGWARTFYLGYNTGILFGGLAVVAYLTFVVSALRSGSAGRARRLFYFLFQNRRTAGILLAFHGLLVMAFLDFQGYPDWFPLLPFISIFAAWLLVRVSARLFAAWTSSSNRRLAAGAALVAVVAVVSTIPAFTPVGRDRWSPRRGTWQEQAQAAAELNAVLPPNAPLFVLGKTDLLFFLGRDNVNKYIYFFGEADAGADAFEPGGFAGMFARVQEARPVFYVLARTPPNKYARRANYDLLAREADSNYIRLKQCRALKAGRYLVRKDLADTLFPRGGEGCLTR
jgi:hypothetical protein